MDKAIKKEKICETILGLLLISPAIISVFDFFESFKYSYSYCGLMAIAGAYMLKNSLRYIFFKDKRTAEGEKDTSSDTAPNS